MALEDGFAWVETQRTNACGSCAVNKGCGTGVISTHFAARFSCVKALNEINAQVNDTVVIGLQERALVRGSFAVYVVPLLSMFFLALIGEFIGNKLLLGGGEGLTVLLGLAGLAAGFLWVRRFSRQISIDERYQPVVMRLSHRAACEKEALIHFEQR